MQRFNIQEEENIDYEYTHQNETERKNNRPHKIYMLPGIRALLATLKGLRTVLTGAPGETDSS